MVEAIKTVLIYSGGLDSTSALYEFKDMIKTAVTFDYGSRHNHKELEMARINCNKLGIEHVVIDLKEVFATMNSALLGSEEIPHGHYTDENMKKTVVPFRNGIMLSIATGIADDRGLDAVMIASHAGDHAIYPDCREEFNKAMGQAMMAGTYNTVNLIAPYAIYTKEEVALRGINAGMQPHLTWSCYEGGDTHCGRCATCVERLEALDGLIDLTAYEDSEYWKGVVNAKNNS